MRIDSHGVRDYFLTLSDLLCGTEVWFAGGERADVARGVEWVKSSARRVHNGGNTLIFVGNGGSAAIASHMATDYSKNGGVRALALNDAAMLTCLGNDYGYDHVFAKQLELHCRTGDLVIAISSSGRSANILNAAAAARAAGCQLVTLSGFTPDNPLRQMGDINFYVDSKRYGFVEIAHLTICHAALDFLCGLPAPKRPDRSTAVPALS